MIVSAMVPPAASAALTRSAMYVPAGAVNAMRYRPGPAEVTVAGCQVIPSSSETCAVALVIAEAGASCR